MPIINSTVLMSGTDYFSDEFAINSYMDDSVAIDSEDAALEHFAIRKAFEEAGIHVVKVHPPEDCQDGVYTANWGLVRGNKVILSNLPNKRKDEEAYASSVLKTFGKEVIPAPYHFSGQGDALPCGNLLFMGSVYRTDPRMHEFVERELGFKVIALQTVPQYDENHQPVINKVSGWPDSFFYDIDLALSVISPTLIAWCPDAFTEDSQEKIRALDIDKIEVSLDEATKGFACNLVSTGETVIMSAHAPELAATLKTKGLNIITPKITELAKGGGYIRCTSLTLDNQ